jgi:hypothetical protein
MAEQPPTNACYRKSGYDKLIKKKKLKKEKNI